MARQKMPWFRMYSEVVNDPKVQSLRPELFKFWVNILCVANEQKERGTLPLLAELAFALHTRADYAARYVGELMRANLLVPTDSGGEPRQPSEGSHDNLQRGATTTFRGLLGGGSWDGQTPLVPYKWRDRQPDSDDIGKRVKRFRDKTSENGQVSDVTLHGTLHVTPNPVTCNVPRGRGVESKREKKREYPPGPPVGGSGVCAASGPGECPPDGDEKPVHDPADPATPAPRSPVRNDPAEVAAVADLAERLFPLLSFGTKVHGFAPSFPVAWIRIAIENAYASEKPRWDYIVGMLRRWDVCGGPPVPSSGPRRKDVGAPAPRTQLPRSARKLTYLKPTGTNGVEPDAGGAVDA